MGRRVLSKSGGWSTSCVGSRTNPPRRVPVPQFIDLMLEKRVRRFGWYSSGRLGGVRVRLETTHIGPKSTGWSLGFPGFTKRRRVGTVWAREGVVRDPTGIRKITPGRDRMPLGPRGPRGRHMTQLHRVLGRITWLTAMAISLEVKGLWSAEAWNRG